MFLEVLGKTVKKIKTGETLENYLIKAVRFGRAH